MKYWIIVNDTRLGPMDLGEVMRTPGFGPETPIWREGLPDWTTASNLPDTASLFRQQAGYSPYQQYYGSRPAPFVQPGEPMYAPGMEPGRAPGPMPPNYLVWAILSTLCCCLPTGVVAIIYASRVNPLYMRGDHEGARKASENASMWVIISFVAGLIWTPFSVIWSLLTM